MVPTTVEIVDIAGLVKGASKGEGLGNQFLGNIRNTDAIIHVLRCFDDDNVIHVDGSVNPVRDKEIIDIELQLKDLDGVDKKISKMEKLTKTGDKEVVRSYELLTGLKAHLEAGRNARSFAVSPEDKEKYIRDLALLTIKPVVYVCNVDEASVVKETNIPPPSWRPLRVRKPKYSSSAPPSKARSRLWKVLRTGSCSWKTWG